MVKLILVEHGNTAKTGDPFFDSTRKNFLDPDLVDDSYTKGKLIAKLITKYIKQTKSDQKILFYSSPMLAAVESAIIIASYIDKKLSLFLKKKEKLTIIISKKIYEVGKLYDKTKSNDTNIYKNLSKKISQLKNMINEQPYVDDETNDIFFDAVSQLDDSHLKTTMSGEFVEGLSYKQLDKMDVDQRLILSDFFTDNKCVFYTEESTRRLNKRVNDFIEQLMYTVKKVEPNSQKPVYSHVIVIVHPIFYNYFLKTLFKITNHKINFRVQAWGCTIIEMDENTTEVVYLDNLDISKSFLSTLVKYRVIQSLKKLSRFCYSR